MRLRNALTGAWGALACAYTLAALPPAADAQQPAQPAQPTQQPAPPPPTDTTGPTPPVMPNIQAPPLPAPIDIPGVNPPTDMPNRPLSAEEAAQIALRHQPNITVAQTGIQAARGVTQQARAGLYPQLGVGAGYTRTQQIASQNGTGGTGGTAGTGGGSLVTTPGYQASANVNQLVFDFNHTRDLVRQAQFSEQAAGANLTRVQQDTVLQVKQAYYTFVQNQRLVAVNEANVRDQQAHVALAQARLTAGVGLPSDVVRAQAAVADAILNLNLARNASSVSRVSLAALMGIDPRTPIVTTDASEPTVEGNDFNALVGSALAQRPEIAEARATIDANRAAVSAARTTNAPSISANLGLSSRGSDFPPGNDAWSIGATIQWNPFDVGLTAGRVRQAQANLAAAQAQLYSTQLQVTSDVSQAYLNLHTAEQRVTIADADVANATEAVRLAEGRYRAGVGTFIDVTDAQSALLTAETNRVNAQSAADQARAALRRAIGSR